MPVIAYEDGHTWGREESKQQWIAEGNTAASWPNQGKLAILKIPGVLAAKAQEFIANQTEDDTGVDAGGVYRRKRWNLLIDSVPATVRNTVASTGEYSTTVANIRTYLKRIRDNAQYIGFD